MKINELMEIVHEAYPDRYTEMYWDPSIEAPQHNSGDGLAQFIVHEVYETFDPEATDEAQLVEAARVMWAAARETGIVALALDNRRS